MSGSKALYILGYSGHAYVVIDVAASMGISVMGYFEKNEVTHNPYSLTYLGDEKEQEGVGFPGDSWVFPAVGTNSVRRRMVELIRNRGWKAIILLDSSAIVSSRASVQDFTLIGPRVIVNSMASIKAGCIINTGAIVEHECEIGAYSHIAPGAILAGGVTVGKETFIGAGAVVKQGVRIGDGVTVGAGSVVLKDIPSGQTWVGNPAKKIR